MHSTNDLTERLTQAGHRAAGRAGATPPPPDSIQVEVARRQRSQRMFAAAFAAVALMAIVPVTAFFLARNDEPAVVTAASDAEALAASVAETTVAPTTTATVVSATPPAPVAPEVLPVITPDLDFGADLDENVNIEMQVGDRDYRLEIIVDDQAGPRAVEAQAASEEVRVIDDTTVWLRDLDGQTEASALLDDDVFAAATGPSDKVIDALDELTALVEKTAPFFAGDLDLEGLLGEDLAPEDFPGPDLDQFFGDDFDLESFPGPDFNLDSWFGPNFDPEEFFGEDGLDLDALREQFEGLEECYGPALDQAEATGTFALPDCAIE